ncbi:MAG: peptidoglycan editing factor PgeF [Candidatus Eisenbacteria bacterium]|nr:peptidoglycan editing factor PgeF [Candidatus Eisenbacteria bacterium]
MWILDDSAATPFWRPRTPRPGTVLLFTTRRGGTSRAPYDTLNLGRSTEDDPAFVLANRERLLLAAGLDPARLATAGQVHGTRVVEVEGPGHHADCDALVTRVPGVTLAVTTADCMSLLYSAPGVVAACHSGWRGTVDGMPAATLEAVCRLAGCAPDAVHVAIGPAIRGCCYEVGEEVASRFPAAAVRRTGVKPHLDLPTAARLALEAAGVAPNALHDTGACTACEAHHYFSHRRDHGLTGRHWGVAALIEAPGAGGGE